MKQIEFNHKLIGKPGIVVKYRNGEIPDFVKRYDDLIRSVVSDGSAILSNLDGESTNTARKHDLFMYREIRTAAEVATDVYSDIYGPSDFDLVFDKHNITALVQAGMDEMKP